MSRIYTSPLWSGVLGATNDVTKFVEIRRVAQDLYEEAGLGGSADIFSGEYTRHDGEVTRVAIKCIRAFNLEKGADEQLERLQKKLLRELKVWRTLSGGANIIELLGIMNGIGPLPSFVCELCPWNLQDYLERKTPPPRHTKMMTDTLRGLSYMHSLESGPVAHGDMKLTNVLVTPDETALICDFGRSRQPNDPQNEVILSSSSPFAGTVRYMSPELLIPNSARPSPSADMWAYGCVALEILCRIQPYHETTSDVVVAELIRSGEPPSDRPRGPRGSLINDTLWNVLSSCWQAQDWRPTAHGFLEELNQMLDNGEVSNSPIPMDMFPRIGSEPIPPWPMEIEDVNGQLRSFTVHSRGLRSTVFS
ncbi:tyrosine kinase domain protein [Rhizoctonia solani AG-3 Rhs1AP]|uniref:Tyrosine kinase domain protein n=2 Tax=Rhizoctonia solani AG-3 TaxID=1086053 RepID=A0A074SPC9_9AGAM|nr:tyrosine kinase domain protein [Rhizoctonia solani AG-3 Rhs1AP]KEP51867.1 tyrosine kinase domain protein [Rhizoctonia solani 123E]